MAQDFTDDCFGPTHSAQTDMANIEANFAALKSSFSGASTPANTVAGMWWLDTTTGILKIRNSANSAWLSVWNMTANKPIIANLLNEITVAMIAASAKDAAAATASLRTLGTGANQACAGNDSRLAGVADGTISQAKLKTATGSASVYHYSASVYYTGIIAGGEYAFMPQIKSEAHDGSRNFQGLWFSNVPLTYSSPVGAFQGGSVVGQSYIQTRYVQACGEVHWIFNLRNRDTGIIEKSWQAPDHCCFGNGGDPAAMQHPYGDYDQDKYELIVINPPLTFVKELKQKAGRGKCILSVIKDEYVIDDLSSPPWPSEKVAVALPEEWEEAWLNREKCEDIKSVIPKPKEAKTRVLKKR